MYRRLLPAVSPALLPQVAVKLGLAQLVVDLVVSVTQPASKLVLGGHLGGVGGHVFLKVLATPPARVQPREKRQEQLEIRLLFVGGLLGVLGCDQVEQSPRRTAQLLNVRRLVLRVRLRFLHILRYWFGSGFTGHATRHFACGKLEVQQGVATAAAKR